MIIENEQQIISTPGLELVERFRLLIAARISSAVYKMHDYRLGHCNTPPELTEKEIYIGYVPDQGIKIYSIEFNEFIVDILYIIKDITFNSLKYLNGEMFLESLPGYNLFSVEIYYRETLKGSLESRIFDDFDYLAGEMSDDMLNDIILDIEQSCHLV